MEDHILHVQMLGGFSMEYNGKRLASEKNFTSKSSQLLQLLFLHMDDGIPKKVLLDALYGREDVENQNGSLNNTIFRKARILIRKAEFTAGKRIFPQKWISIVLKRR